MTYDEVVVIPESRRSSAQQRIVAEWEWEQAQRPAQVQPARAPMSAADQAVRDSLFESYERFLAAIAHIECAAGPYDPKVARRDDYVHFVQFLAMSAKDRDDLIHFTNLYFQNNPDLSWSV